MVAPRVALAFGSDGRQIGTPPCEWRLAPGITVGPYRLVRRPIVVRFEDPGSPFYLVYVRLNRSLATGDHSALIALDDQTSPDDGRGHDDHWGYDVETARPHCYVKLIDVDPDVPSPLFTTTPGRRVVVAVTAFTKPGRPGGRVGAYTRVVAAWRDEPRAQTDGARWHELGCRPQQ